MHRIMLVEDDEALCAQIIDGLKKWGFCVDAAVNFENIIEDFNSHNKEVHEASILTIKIKAGDWIYQRCHILPVAFI